MVKEVERIIIPAFCMAIERTDEDKKTKLNKVNWIGFGTASHHD
jgi:hypothetical protein